MLISFNGNFFLRVYKVYPSSSYENFMRSVGTLLGGLGEETGYRERGYDTKLCEEREDGWKRSMGKRKQNGKGTGKLKHPMNLTISENKPLTDS